MASLFMLGFLLSELCIYRFIKWDFQVKWSNLILELLENLPSLPVPINYALYQGISIFPVKSIILKTRRPIVTNGFKYQI